MRQNSQLSGVLHILLHMAELDGPVTSDRLAKMMKTNPVVIRRIMAGLRENGLVQSEKGHGGGWRLTRGLSEMTLLDIYKALGEPAVFAIGNRTESPTCLLEQSANASINQALKDAEDVLLARLRAVTLEDLKNDVGDQVRDLRHWNDHDSTA
ncbi:MAG: Rrf2 family transcriptional regulator [Sphaerobacteraceae bacterium]|nr:MAG: Rrf2 family transcriptional regulator [Sphaerobacteraceae bacterium]